MIVLGADMHKRSHTIAAVDAATGGRLTETTVQVGARGFDEVLTSARGLGRQRVWALEDCRHVSGSFERFLIARGERVIRVPTTLMAGERRGSRQRGKSDSIDALAVARAALREGIDSLPAAQLDGAELDLRLLVDHRERLIRQRVALNSILQWHLHDLWPELRIPAARCFTAAGAAASPAGSPALSKRCASASPATSCAASASSPARCWRTCWPGSCDRTGRRTARWSSRGRGRPVDEDDLRQLASRAFDRARAGAKAENATPYALRYSFASLLLHEGRSVVYVARQLGHDARLTLTTYGHVIDELDDQPRVSAEDAIRTARQTSCVPGASGHTASGDAG